MQADPKPILQPRWRAALPAVAVILLVPLFLFLGWWQLQRAEEKRQLQQEYDTRGSSTPVRVEPRPQAASDLRFYRVQATGYYEPAHQILLDNRVHLGQVGYYVITPLRIEGGDVRVLVNRGWVPLGESRERLPAIATPEGRIAVTGIATVPSDKGYRLAAQPTSGGWNPVWPYMDLARYAAAAPFVVQPVVILLDPDQAAGFTRDWSRLDAGIAVHQGYAFQWFALALALAVLFFLLRWRRTRVGGSSLPGRES